MSIGCLGSFAVQCPSLIVFANKESHVFTYPFIFEAVFTFLHIKFELKNQLFWSADSAFHAEKYLSTFPFMVLYFMYLKKSFIPKTKRNSPEFSSKSEHFKYNTIFKFSFYVIKFELSFILR